MGGDPGIQIDNSIEDDIRWRWTAEAEYIHRKAPTKYSLRKHSAKSGLHQCGKEKQSPNVISLPGLYCIKRSSQPII